MCKQLTQLMAPCLAVLASMTRYRVFDIVYCQFSFYLFQFTGSDKGSSGDPLLSNDYGDISGQDNHVTTEKSASTSTLTTIKNLDTTKNNAGMTPSNEILVDDDFGFGELGDQDFARITTINPRFL